MNRLLVVHCPTLVDDDALGDEGGAAFRLSAKVVEAVEAYCPWVTTVRTGLCSLPIHGPARYFGGEDPLVRLVADAVAPITTAGVGVADGLFAAVLAARDGVIVPPGGTPHFLAPYPVTVLGHPDLAELSHRLGIRTVGDFADLPEPHVLGRFGADGARCHRVARGLSDELVQLDEPAGRRPVATRRRGQAARRAVTDQPRGPVVEGPTVEAPGFWGGTSDADARAARALGRVQGLLGPEAVVAARLHEGRYPAQRARFVTWTGTTGGTPSPDRAPWPGRIPSPAPAVVHPVPLPAELTDATTTILSVTGRGLLTGVPCRLSVDGGAFAEVTAWAGPWPSDERWWSRSRRRHARLQAVTGPVAHLLAVEHGRWQVEATYG